MEQAILVVHLIVVIALIVLVLLQKSEGGALGMGGGGGGGGGMGGIFSTRGAANVLTRTTAILAIIFFSTSLTLGILAQNTDAPSSVLDAVIEPGDEQPTAPGLPGDSGTGQGILDTLRQQSPEPATGPQVPNSQ
ncbi:MAG: preprotein translocase subunit SecG [Pseudomonadota bacterium]